jgi:hypothetical protein
MSRQYAQKIGCNLYKIAHVQKLMRKMRSKAYWTVSGKERGAIIASRDEVEDDETRHAIPQ